ncbi:tryptophan-rich sensory protein [Glutamicibacter sp. MNS18]|uniref:tryptophan-rich sensory protein n=1 Tax=Glutamicibacter sp. MNS18 TaxID=2989817 RepID=UPI002236314D|nr:tryptophan-rich sensory protein [Glutamicibacter sp. MNS18]MCW4466110.1 tryptophan-rich sensory protein [Glutamicibacter sp. MNS18]
MSRTTQSTRRAPLGIPVLTAAAMAIAIFGAFLGSGAWGGTPIREASGGWLDTDSTLLSPAGPAFGIWSVIYCGLAVYAIWQFTGTARTSVLQARTRGWVIASALLNAVWIGVVQLGWLAASLAVILILLAVLIRLFILLVATPAPSAVERWLMWVVFGLYLGWVNVASIANTAALLGSLGVGQDASWITPLAVALLAVAVLIGLGTCWYSRGHLGAPAAMAWGIAWIGVSRLDSPNASDTVAIAAFTGSGVLVLGALALAWVLRSRRGDRVAA